ncbi:MAG: hypothetical protein ACOYLG_12545 [Chitinophagaceae bacterium]
MKKKILFLIITCWALSTTAQQKDYSAYPYWVDMIDNPSTNYFEAIKAFDEYWKHHIKPMDEEEVMFEEMNETEKLHYAVLVKHLETMTPAERREFDRLKYHYKRFKQWKLAVFTYVQEDGRILSDEERLRIWQDQQNSNK